MNRQGIAQTNQQQKRETPLARCILQRASVRSVADTGVQSTDNREAQALSNSAFSKDFSQVPISTTKPPQIMAKLMIGTVGDKYEQEVDIVAAEVGKLIINTLAPQPPGQGKGVESEAIQTKENEAKLMRLSIVKHLFGDGGMAAPPDLEASIQQARGSGQPLADNIRQPMEQAFGADFRGVKVHTDVQSDHLNQLIQAKAFTTGQDIFFRKGAYHPWSSKGKELIAHELTHVEQQKKTTGKIITERQERSGKEEKEVEGEETEKERKGEQPNNINPVKRQTKEREDEEKKRGKFLDHLHGKEGVSGMIQRFNQLEPGDCIHTEEENPWTEIYEQLQIDKNIWTMDSANASFLKSISVLGEKSTKSNKAVATYDGFRKGTQRTGDLQQTAYGHLGEIEAWITGTGTAAAGKFEGGHLCSDAGLGVNSYKSYNFAPQRSNMNNPDYRKIEEIAEGGIRYTGTNTPIPTKPRWKQTVEVKYPNNYIVLTQDLETRLNIPSQAIKANPKPNQVLFKARVPNIWNAKVETGDKDWVFNKQTNVDPTASGGAGPRFMNSETDVMSESANTENYLGLVRWSMNSMQGIMTTNPNAKQTLEGDSHTWLGIQDVPRGQQTLSPGVPAASISPATVLPSIPKLTKKYSFSMIPSSEQGKINQSTIENLATNLLNESYSRKVTKVAFTGVLTIIAQEKRLLGNNSTQSKTLAQVANKVKAAKGSGKDILLKIYILNLINQNFTDTQASKPW